MMGKLEILFVILIILLAFYFVISWGSGGKESSKNPNIKNYLFGVRVLISLIGVIAVILWSFF